MILPLFFLFLVSWSLSQLALCPDGVSSSPPPSGYREPEEDDTSLHAVLDSLLPFIRDPNSSVQLPVYLGNSVIRSANCVGEASLLVHMLKGQGKSFPGLGAWV
jgi:hypothetical protein